MQLSELKKMIDLTLERHGDFDLVKSDEDGRFAFVHLGFSPLKIGIEDNSCFKQPYFVEYTGSDLEKTNAFKVEI